MLNFGRLFGDENARALKRFSGIPETVNPLEAGYAALPEDAFPGKTKEFRERHEAGEDLDALLPEAFALVREAAKRTLAQRHFDVQLLGGAVLHAGNIAEMRTGEGKTLVATLPAYLNALTGKGVHVVTVNDYLARRDAVWMGQIYAYLGLSVGVINHDASYIYDQAHLPAHEDAQEADEKRDREGSYRIAYEFLRPCTRQEAYAADITYGTNNEFGFDYLRDHLAYRTEDLRQRGHGYAIVDEIDSILIDEARTPLIISAPAAESGELYHTFARIAGSLVEGTDYTLEEKHRTVQLTDAGIEKAEKILGVGNIYTDAGIKYVHHLETAVRAKALFRRDKEYVVRDGQVIIVDEFTGRLMPGRRWSEGLHQAVEAKEGVAVQKESRTFASITFQNYFRMYEKLSGMTGTARTSAEEFYKVYGLETITIPTNKPVARKDHNDLIFQTEQGKYRALAKRVKELHAKGQPVLIGTVSIEKNEVLSAYLRQEGIPHEMLNAKNHEKEADIIAQAGERGKVTVATNMAGRGVDIKLGGNPGSPAAYEEIKAQGGLFVLGTERHEARRIDNQLRGRSGRQGDPGETQFYVSLEDSLMRVFASETIKRMMGRFGIPEDQPIENSLITRSLETAQSRIEGFNFDARKHVLAYDDVLNLQRKAIYQKRTEVLQGSNDALEAVLGALVAGDEKLAATVEEKKKALGREPFLRAFQRMYLQAVDMYWVEHLETMDYLRGSVNLRAVGQRDPLIEYRKEGSRLFHALEEHIEEKIIELIPTLASHSEEPVVPAELREIHENAKRIGAEQGGGRVSGSARLPSHEKIGRNELVQITDGKDTKTMKYKKAEPLLQGGAWKLIQK